MAKTRSQTGNITIKKEEKEDCKPTRTLVSTNNTRNKIAKKKPSKNSNSPAPDIKVEEDTDTKSLLKSASNHSKSAKNSRISQEQITQLIDYVVNHKMSITKASRKVKVSISTAYAYYNMYNNDPDKKIPSPRIQYTQDKTFYTQKQIENLIRYIDNDKMTISGASAKAYMSCTTGHYYYKKYLLDSDHVIPIPRLCQNYTQDQKNEFLRYIVNDKMSITAASKKAKMNVTSARRHYHKYFNDQNPAPSHITAQSHYTQEQIKQAISYIIDDKMTIAAASRKANISETSVGKYYHQYLKDNNMEIPVSKSKCGNRYTQEKKDQLIHIIVNEKMTPTAAGKKLHMSSSTAQRHYYQYLKDNSLPLPASKRITQDQFDEFIGYIFDDKMSINAASRKANMPCATGYYHLQRYLKKHNISKSSTSNSYFKIHPGSNRCIDWLHCSRQEDHSGSFEESKYESEYRLQTLPPISRESKASCTRSTSPSCFCSQE